MPDDLATAMPRSRRAILAAAAAGAAGLAASRLGAPEAAKAATSDPLTVGGTATGYMETTALQVSTGGAIGSNSMAEAALYVRVDGTGTGSAIHGNAIGLGTGVAGESLTGYGVYGSSGNSYGVFATTTSSDSTKYAMGVDGQQVGGIEVHATTVGVWAATPTGTAGTIGVAAGGDIGGQFASGTGTAVMGYLGALPPARSANTALYGYAGTSQYGLVAKGGVKFPDRSGKVGISKGKASGYKNVAGVTSSNIAIAQLGTNQSGRWVRAAVCSSGRVTVYLNTTASSATWATFFILG